jgi:predicted GH43/DUF377 family glycosyl hydrolase
MKILQRSRWIYGAAALAALGLAVGTNVATSAHVEASTSKAGADTFAVDARSHAQRRSAVFPSWAIGPFERYQHNPILAAPVVPTASNSWEWPEQFNPGVVVVNGVFHMLYRGTNWLGVSEIGAATSSNGYRFTRVSGQPVISGTLPSENQGVEDPRLYYLAGKYYTFFTGDSGATNSAIIDINEAVSTDARNWTQLGPVLDNTKDAAVVVDPEGRPVRINGEYLMYYGQMGEGHLAESTDFEHWTTVGSVNVHFPARYEPWEFCVAVTNYRTKAKGGVQTGIDLFVAGQLMGRGHWFYAISEVKFDRSRLLSAAAELKFPVLYPQAPYEIYGSAPHTVFMNNIIFYRGQWWMYYGAANSVVALANAELR